MTPDEVREARNTLGLTQAQAARLVGVDERSWRRWENGTYVVLEPVARLIALAVQSPMVRRVLQEWSA